jgi:hypothetical protein
MTKPTVANLGIDPDAQQWRRSGPADQAIEVAFVEALGQTWVLMRITDDPDGRVLVYNTDEWDAFLDGAKNGEFDDAAGGGQDAPRR